MIRKLEAGWYHTDIEDLGYFVGKDIIIDDRYHGSVWLIKKATLKELIEYCDGHSTIIVLPKRDETQWDDELGRYVKPQKDDK